MKKLSEMFKKLWTKFKSFSKKVRISIIVAVVAVLIALISLVVAMTSTKYEVLFSNLDSTDANTIKAKLDEEKVSMKVEGNSILVPEDKVDELRLSLASDLTTGSTGYELMDASSSFGMTDEEFSIKKVRMVQGELEKTIKSLDSVESARVHITAAEDSVFATESQEGKAAVILKLKTGAKITDDQVKSIVAIVSSSLENTPKSNVEVVDSNMNLLSSGISDDSETGSVSSDSIQQKKDLENQEGDKYAKAIVSLLEPVVGTGKVSASVNVDLDFDSTQKTTTTIDPNKVIVSQQTDKSTSKDGTGATSESPVDENMSATIDEGTDSNVTSVTESQTTNYDSGKSETKVISSPGEIKRMTASIFIDGDISEATRTQLEKSVSSAIGIDSTRGDEISLVGMEFDTAAKQATEDQVAQFNEELKTAQRNKIIMVALIVIGIIAFIVTMLVLRKKKKEREEEDRLLDVVIDDNGTFEDTAQYNPIEFDVPSKQAHIENEIKNYAKEKPEQVADIVKSWLKENER